MNYIHESSSRTTVTIGREDEATHPPVKASADRKKTVSPPKTVLHHEHCSCSMSESINLSTGEGVVASICWSWGFLRGRVILP